MKYYEGILHVYPLNDVAEHVTDGEECWCGADDDGDVVVHTYEQQRSTAH